MILYVLCLNPLIKLLERNLNAIKTGRHQSKTAVTAHADVTTFPTSEKMYQN